MLVLGFDTKLKEETYGQYPGRIPPLAPVLPASNHVFMYGDLTTSN